MIYFLDTKPDKIFDHLPMDHVWLLASNSKGEYARLAIYMDGNGSAAIHAVASRWGRDVLKSAKEDWVNIKKFLKLN